MAKDDAARVRLLEWARKKGKEHPNPCTYTQYWDFIHKMQTEYIAELETMVERLGSKLHRYGRHEENCNCHYDDGRSAQKIPRKCNCGFDDPEGGP